VYPSFDFSRFERCQVVLDGRHALRHEMIESLDMRYITIGDGNHVRAMREDSEALATLPVSEEESA